MFFWKEDSYRISIFLSLHFFVNQEINEFFSSVPVSNRESKLIESPERFISTETETTETVQPFMYTFGDDNGTIKRHQKQDQTQDEKEPQAERTAPSVPDSTRISEWTVRAHRY